MTGSSVPSGISDKKPVSQLEGRVPNASGKPQPPPAKSPDEVLKVGQIRDAIPAHCFERNTLKSLSHVAIDLAIVGAIFAASRYISLLPTALQWVAWPVYWYLQGLFMTGLWVLAHECGHGAFSSSKLVNDTVGWVLHSALLVPYFSWKYSHATHHKNTCSMENDEVFVPATRSDYIGEMIAETPIANAIEIFFMLTIGWPGYLILNASGPAKYRKEKHNSHFHPYSALFTDRQRRMVVLSDVGFFGMIALLIWACNYFGAMNVFFHYFMPYLVVNLHLVLITFLQHTDTYVPHYREKEFTWLRGALATVDRSYGQFVDAATHHISDTHVVHHLFHEMPWYNAQEATEAVKKVLGPYYLKDDTSIPVALWNVWNKCKFVEDEGDVLFYKDAQAFKAGSSKKRA